MSLIMNFIWIIFGGIIMALLWYIIGIIMYISILGIPWGKACFVIGNFNLVPFGKEMIDRKELSGKDDIGTGTLGAIGNIIWLFPLGIILALGHFISAIANFVTIIGIPFGIQHLKLASISLLPIGKTIVTKEVAEAARQASAKEKVEKLRAKN